MTTLPPHPRTCAPGVRSEGPYEYEETWNEVVRYEEMQDEVVRYKATQERTKAEARMMSWAL